MKKSPAAREQKRVDKPIRIKITYGNVRHGSVIARRTVTRGPTVPPRSVCPWYAYGETGNVLVWAAMRARGTFVSTTYEYTAQLAETTGGNVTDYVVLEFREVCDAAKGQIRQTWHKMAQAEAKLHELTKKPLPHWCSWKLHEWVDRSEADLFQFVAWEDDQVAGFLSIREKLGPSSLPYVEHLIAFPGNMHTRLWRRRLKSVGVALAARAATHSEERGSAGRFALHSVPNAEQFWLALGKNVPGFYSMNVVGVPGLHAANLTQRYFELSAVGATDLLGRFS